MTPLTMSEQHGMIINMHVSLAGSVAELLWAQCGSVTELLWAQCGSVAERPQ